MPTDRPDPSGEEPQETCVWCMADRQTFIGCCGRERAHHHTMTKWRGDVVRIIPSDDCPEAPLPPPATPEQPDPQARQSYNDTEYYRDPQEEAARAVTEGCAHVEMTTSWGEKLRIAACLACTLDAIRAARRQGFEEGQKAGREERE